MPKTSGTPCIIIKLFTYINYSTQRLNVQHCNYIIKQIVSNFLLTYTTATYILIFNSIDAMHKCAIENPYDIMDSRMN